MLAQSFKTATELKLSDLAYQALKLALIELEMDKIPHYHGRMANSLPYEKYRFNMRAWATLTPCGTICCIGGLAQELVGPHSGVFDTSPPSAVALNELFRPGSISRNIYAWDEITPQLAAKCLRHYLETGIVNWNAVLDRVDHASSNAVFVP